MKITPRFWRHNKLAAVVCMFGLFWCGVAAVMIFLYGQFCVMLSYSSMKHLGVPKMYLLYGTNILIKVKKMTGIKFLPFKDIHYKMRLCVASDILLKTYIHIQDIIRSNKNAIVYVGLISSLIGRKMSTKGVVTAF